jgi:hypothetical protein
MYSTLKHTSPKTHLKGANKPSYKPQIKIGSSKQYRRLHRRSKNIKSHLEVEVEPSNVARDESVLDRSCVAPQQMPNANSWNKMLYSISHG